MKSRNLWYLLTLIACALLQLAGCSGGEPSQIKSTPKGYELQLSGSVETGAAKSTGKSVFLNSTTAGANGLGTVFVYDANAGTQLGSASVQSDGTFSNLGFTLTATKSTVVFKAVTTKGTFRYLLPIDLSNPPTTTGLGNNTVQIVIGQASTNQVASISFDLGLAGQLGDTGVTIPAAKTFSDVTTSVLKYGGQALSYSSNGINLGAKLDNPLLPAQGIASQTADSIYNLKLSGKVTKVVIPESGKPIVSFQVTDAGGKGVSGLLVANFRPSLIKLVAGTSGSPDQWISYHPKNATDQTRNDSGGTLIDNGDGSYLYYFGTSVTDKTGKWAYDSATTNRLILMVSGATVTGGTVTIKNAANIIYDFVPNGGEVTLKREVVTMAACLECHTKFTAFHGGGRQDPAYCVACHNNSVLGNKSGDIALGNGDDTKTRNWSTEGITDGMMLGDFVVLVHKIHMGSKLHTNGWNWSGITFKEGKYPGDINDCGKCHKGAQGNNWKTKPSRVACGSCHDNVNWKTGANTRTTAKIGGAGYVHPAAILGDDSQCASCHGESGPYPVATYHTLPATADATKRTMSATITGVTVDATTGKVTATFTVSDGGVPVTDKTKFSAPTFVLAKLVKDESGVLNWVGYTNQFNTKNAALGLVKQTKGENDGTLVANADGSFSYTFKLKTATPEGDIRNVTHAHNVAKSSATLNVGKYDINTTGAYVTSTDADRLLYGAAVELPYPVTYEPTKTHRVAMTFQKLPEKIDAANAWFDFVPDGSAVTDKRAIVKMANCASCHANKKLHAAYEIEVCVTCHNPTTKDPGTGETVALETLVHKLHMGKNLPSVKAGGTYVVNVAHDYTKANFPSPLANCAICHVETGNAQGANWRTNPTRAACGTCHNSTAGTAHIDANGNACVVCHGTNRAADTKVKHRW